MTDNRKTDAFLTKPNLSFCRWKRSRARAPVFFRKKNKILLISVYAFTSLPKWYMSVEKRIIITTLSFLHAPFFSEYFSSRVCRCFALYNVKQAKRKIGRAKKKTLRKQSHSIDPNHIINLHCSIQSISTSLVAHTRDSQRSRATPYSSNKREMRGMEVLYTYIWFI